MSDFKNELAYVIIESDKVYGYDILAQVISILNKNLQSHIILACSEETRNLINDFPWTPLENIEFYDCSEISTCSFNLIRKYYHNLYQVSNYVLDNYEECVFICEEALMVNPVEINDTIKEQGFGYMKKYYETHEPEDEFRTYTFELIYMNNKSFIEDIKSFFLEEHTIDISNNDDDECKEIDLLMHLTLPFKLKGKQEISHFLERCSMIASEDFLGFKNELKISLISKDLQINEKPISFMLIRSRNDLDVFIKVNRDILTIMTRHNSAYILIFSLKCMKSRIQFKVPGKKNIGVWSREKEPNGLYDIIDYICNEYDSFFTCSKDDNSIFFKIGSEVLYDKPDTSCLIPSLRQFSYLTYFNADKSVPEEVGKYLPTPHKFLSYYPDNPLFIHNFRTQNTSILVNGERSSEKLVVNKIVKNGKTRYPATGRRGMLYKTFIKLIKEHKYAYVKCHDLGLITSLIGVGTVPILQKAPEEPFKLLKENVHYLVDKPNLKLPGKKKYAKLRENINAFYEEHLHPEKILFKLTDHLFVGDVE